MKVARYFIITFLVLVGFRAESRTVIKFATKNDIREQEKHFSRYRQKNPETRKRDNYRDFSPKHQKLKKLKPYVRRTVRDFNRTSQKFNKSVVNRKKGGAEGSVGSRPGALSKEGAKTNPNPEKAKLKQVIAKDRPIRKVAPRFGKKIEGKKTARFKAIPIRMRARHKISQKRARKKIRVKMRKKKQRFVNVDNHKTPGGDRRFAINKSKIRNKIRRKLKNDLAKKLKIKLKNKFKKK